MRYWIGLGSNLGCPEEQVHAALSLLGADPSIDIGQVSRMVRSHPWGRKNQPDFVNAVARLESLLDPMDLLRRLQSIESRLGRVRAGRRWGPRVIDLDLLLVDDRILHLEELVIPHPRMHRRRFVLEPLAELDPELVIPARGRIGRLLAALPEGGVRSLNVP